MRKAYCITLCILALLGQSTALYQDQAGTFDWHQQHVGGILTASSPAGRSKITLVSNRNIIAALRSSDGGVAWRRHLGPHDAITGSLILDKPAAVLTVSGNGRVIRSWDANTGVLNWEAASGAESADVGLLQVTGPSAQFVAAAVASTVQLYGAETGAQHWSAQVELAAGASPALQQHEDKLYVVAIKPGASAAQVTTLAVPTGSILATASVRSPAALGSSAGSIPRGLVVLSADSTQLCLLEAGSSAFSCQQISQISSKLPAGSPLQISATSAGLLLVSADPSKPGAALLATTGGSAAYKLLVDSSSATAAAPEVDLGSETKAAALIEPSADGTGVTVTTYSTKTGKVLAKVEAPSARQQAGTPALPAKAFLVPSRKGAEATGVLLVWQDEVLQLLSEGAVQWSREEALAGVSSSVFVDLPAEGRDVEGAALAAARPEMTMQEQLHMQLLSFKVQFKLNTEEEAAELVELRQQLSDKNKPTRDINGFRRMIVVATEAGKVFALHNGDGRVLWSLNYGPGAAPSELHLWRSFHDVTHAPHIVAFHLAGSSPFASVINAHTGAQIEKVKLSAGVSKVVPISQTLHDGTAEQRLFLLPGQASAAGQLVVHTLPGTPAAQQLLQQQYTSLYLWQHSAEGLAGYGFTKAGAAMQPPVAMQVWQVHLPDPVVSVAARDASEPLHSYVKVLGDRSMKYKYLNPSTVFVATASAAGVTVYILDTVTGGVLHSQSHAGGRGPVHALLSEHFVVYHLFNSKQGRFEVVVMELYDATPRAFSIADVLGGKATSQAQASSLQPADLEVLTQAYYLPSPVVTLSVTRTAKAITTKQVLLGTSSDQVYAMDKRFLDPRRPAKKKLSAEEMEEGLVPYGDTLPLFPQMYATYDKQILGLKAVLTAATGLESTSLVFAHGVDLFHSRLAPAKNFDSLNDDFSYALLVISLLGLMVAASAVNYMAARAQLKAKWQ